MVAGHPWTATCIDEVTSSEASPSEAEFERCSSATSVRLPSTVSPARQRRSPAEVRAVASTKIFRIQAAIASLGPDNAEERATLETALTRTQQLAAVPLVDKRTADTEAFVARAQKRVAAEAANLRSGETEAVGCSRRSWPRQRKIWKVSVERPRRSRSVEVAKSQCTPCHRWRPSLREFERSWLS